MQLNQIGYRSSFMGHALMENRNGLIVGAVATRASGHAERLAALHLMEPPAERAAKVTLAGDKGFDTQDFVAELREINVTPHVAQNISGRRSAIDRQTTRYPGYEVSLRIRKRIEEPFAGRRPWRRFVRRGIADWPKSTGNSLSPWRHTILSGYRNCWRSRQDTGSRPKDPGRSGSLIRAGHAVTQIGTPDDAAIDNTVSMAVTGPISKTAAVGKRDDVPVSLDPGESGRTERPTLEMNLAVGTAHFR